jgi:mitogen-activated protein kinase kinase
MKLPPGSTGGAGTPPQGHSGSPFSNFSKIVDPSGSLNFQNKAVLHAKGVDFSNGSSFAINMDDLELREELGSGNYGTVQKVYHKVTKVTMAMKVGTGRSQLCTRITKTTIPSGNTIRIR